MSKIGSVGHDATQSIHDPHKHEKHPDAKRDGSADQALATLQSLLTPAPEHTSPPQEKPASTGVGPTSGGSQA